jgi:hypothetical protein
MRHQPFLRLLVGSALLASAVSLSAASLPAVAATIPAVPLTVTCTTLTGGAATQELSHCTGSGAVVSQIGKSPAHGKSDLATSTVTWSNGKRTKETFTYATVAGPANNCAVRANYTKDYLVTEQGYVADSGTTAKGLVGGAIRATVCVYKLTAAPHTIFMINRGKIKI